MREEDNRGTIRISFSFPTSVFKNNNSYREYSMRQCIRIVFISPVPCDLFHIFYPTSLWLNALYYKPMDKVLSNRPVRPLALAMGRCHFANKVLDGRPLGGECSLARAGHRG